LQLKPASVVGGNIVLEVTGLSKYFGGLKAVDGVDIAVKRGGVHAADRAERFRQDHHAQRCCRASIRRRLARSCSTAPTSPRCRRTCEPRLDWAYVSRTSACFRSMTALENVEIAPSGPGNSMIVAAMTTR